MRINCKVFSWDKKDKEQTSDLSFELTSKTSYSSTPDLNRSIVFIDGHPYTVNIPYEELKELLQQLKGMNHGERNYS